MRDAALASPSAPAEAGRKLRFGLWAAQALLAAFFGFVGFSKLTLPIPELASMMKWPGDVSPALVRFVGAAELAGAIGIVLPALTRVLPLLTPAAAVGLAVIQALAIVFHAVRGETAFTLPINLALLAATLFVAWGRYRRLPIRRSAPRA